MNTEFYHPLRESLEACTGCAACAAVCPSDAITMQPDKEGFLHPRINTLLCSDCGLCNEVCPVKTRILAMEKQDRHELNSLPLAVWAAWHLDDLIRRESSSGGVFTALAENILSNGGVVVGAVLDDKLIVRHAIIEKLVDLGRLRGSKYVQSEVAPDLYRQVRNLLKEDRYVLFSGTPCQIEALKNFVSMENQRLFLCDIVCHGVPSPLFFSRYVLESLNRGERLSSVSFRDKSTGWKNSSVRLYLHNGLTRLAKIPWGLRSSMIASLADPYMAAFHRNYTLRSSCYSCKFTATVRSGDLTLGDFWGVGKKYPQYDLNDNGTSLVLVNTEKGRAWLAACQSHLFIGAADIDIAISGNPMLARPCNRPPERDNFYHDLERLSFLALTHKYDLRPRSLPLHAVRALRRRLRVAIRILTTYIFKREAS